jgi:cyclopropane-fatty-acyl-phospholipid synthase
LFFPLTCSQIFIRSRPKLQSDPIPGVSTLPAKLFSVVTYITNSRFANTISNSLSNIRAHYDLSNGMFAAFLSRDMTYSCGIFTDLDGDLKDGRQLGAVNGAIGLKKIGGIKENKEAKVDGEIKDELEAAQLRKIQ